MNVCGLVDDRSKRCARSILFVIAVVDARHMIYFMFFGHSDILPKFHNLRYNRTFFTHNMPGILESPLPPTSEQQMHGTSPLPVTPLLRTPRLLKSAMKRQPSVHSRSVHGLQVAEVKEFQVCHWAKVVACAMLVLLRSSCRSSAAPRFWAIITSPCCVPRCFENAHCIITICRNRNLKANPLAPNTSLGSVH